MRNAQNCLATLFSFIVLTFSYSAVSEPAECIKITALNSFVVDLHSANNFFNCTNVSEIPEGNEIIINVVSTNQEIPFTLVVYDMAEYTAKEIARESSPSGATIQYESIVQTSDIGFRIVPDSSVSENIRMTVSLGISENSGGLFFVNLDYAPPYAAQAH
ncbi:MULTISPECIES: hypothetical protein [Gammaproteobacteria]|uniref:hypothetical protein n=1 Tax=Gammaproteobacteria TaxID=1236 RepID=UPI000DD00322|nr:MULTISPECIES: hypothetical protein [Gammaproteobacteria]RTE86918.1 hypothetical protein DQX04_00570 [Aliidiomarina sp. B3213]TCZ93292.1 hypothetical protein EYQ95_04730 [Lysobacter sp. N42]